MPRYHLQIRDGPSEVHVLNLPDDTRAIEETLRTAAGLIRDLSLKEMETKTQLLDLSEDGKKPVLTIEIMAARKR
jgi:hypothetical protein